MELSSESAAVAAAEAAAADNGSQHADIIDSGRGRAVSTTSTVHDHSFVFEKASSVDANGERQADWVVTKTTDDQGGQALEFHQGSSAGDSYIYKLWVSPFVSAAGLQRASMEWTGWTMPAEVPKEQRDRFFVWCLDVNT